MNIAKNPNVDNITISSASVTNVIYAAILDTFVL